MLLNDFQLNADDMSNEAKQRFPFYMDIQNNQNFFGGTALINERLTSGGRHILCSQIIRSYEVVKSVLNYLTTTPLQSKEKITNVPMIVICGLPRTGTTLLYNLMACDPACRAPLVSDMTISQIPPISRSNVDEHKRRMAAERDRLIQVFEAAGSDFGRFSKVFCSSHPLFPIEEDTALLGGNLDIKIALYNLVPKHKSLVTCFTDNQNSNYMYDYHQTVLQMLHDVDPPHTNWLLKSPFHTFWLNTLLKYYPKASLIMVHRHLDEVLPSACRLALAMCHVYLEENDSVSSKKIIEETRLIMNIWIQRLIEFRMQHPPPENVCDIQYEDLMKDPIGTVHRIYDHFHFLRWSDAFEKAMRAWLTDNPQGKQGRNFHSLAEFGFKEDESNELYEKYENMFLTS
ncbi:unnamed protein product [Adineta steineri]|uniref:Sulfotransferase n=1 Tax=Adineta steineri TaxID=433720 RepID=A0A820CKZ1_9BILA|nr:unnamed protein product [Adineta steineri]